MLKSIENPALSSQGEIMDVAIAARSMLELAWSDETAYQGIDLQPGDPSSRGQCGVSSLWLARFLHRRGVEAYFVEGKIGVDGLNEDHVWVESIVNNVTRIVDLTSDQYVTINGAPVHFGIYNSGPGSIGSYTPEQRFEPDKVPRKKLLARFAILEANIANLPRRRRLV